ncbi:MAG: phosphate/phosphite/phosphonate ABC transporter substrate-binding protein [Deltaproteobacteria bacterium HGW-Deltaproteobacteria-4]|nr:MAG: phosphate/phosphite/phosphonate ABC transporter substrate-binding protein [Deltaproteobacteria bacterium HGW-Deltaproteobacteria-4]
MSRIGSGLILGLALVCICGCQREEPLKVKLSERTVVTDSSPGTETQKPLTVSVGSMITPQAGYGYYRQLIDYLSGCLGRKIDSIDPGNYAETNRLLQTGEADFAFVCGGPYVSGHERFGLELLVAPVVNGKTVYYSYLIVPAESTTRHLSDLRGKSFVFTDPQSNSGKLVPTAMLARLGQTPEQFFSSITYTYGHDRSIQAVADNIVDGAAVDSLIWEYIAVTQPALTAKTRIIERSEPFGIPPVVTSPHLSPELRKVLQQALLTIHEDPHGLKILKGMNIERFVLIDDSAYDGIRRLEGESGPLPTPTATK